MFQQQEVLGGMAAPLSSSRGTKYGEKDPEFKKKILLSSKTPVGEGRPCPSNSQYLVTLRGSHISSPAPPLSFSLSAFCSQRAQQIAPYQLSG